MTDLFDIGIIAGLGIAALLFGQMIFGAVKASRDLAVRKGNSKRR